MAATALESAFLLMYKNVFLAGFDYASAIGFQPQPNESEIINQKKTLDFLQRNCCQNTAVIQNLFWKPFFWHEQISIFIVFFHFFNVIIFNSYERNKT